MGLGDCGALAAMGEGTHQDHGQGIVLVWVGLLYDTHMDDPEIIVYYRYDKCHDIDVHNLVLWVLRLLLECIWDRHSQSD